MGRTGDLWTLGVFSLTPAGLVLGTGPAASAQLQGSPTGPLVRTTLGHPPPQPLSQRKVPTCLLNGGHPRGYSSAVTEPADVFREHSEGVGVTNDEVRDGAAGAGAALQHREPFLEGKRRKKESSEKDREREAVTRMVKVWGMSGSAVIPLPSGHHQQQECPGSPHSSCLTSAPCSP